MQYCVLYFLFSVFDHKHVRRIYHGELWFCAVSFRWSFWNGNKEKERRVMKSVTYKRGVRGLLGRNYSNNCCILPTRNHTIIFFRICSRKVLNLRKNEIGTIVAHKKKKNRNQASKLLPFTSIVLDIIWRQQLNKKDTGQLFTSDPNSSWNDL